MYDKELERKKKQKFKIRINKENVLEIAMTKYAIFIINLLIS